MMKRLKTSIGALSQRLSAQGVGLRGKLITVFLLVMVIPLVILTMFAWNQLTELGTLLQKIAVDDASLSLNASAVENIERMSTDTADDVADFLYARDADLRYLATLAPSWDAYHRFGESIQGRLMDPGSWDLSADGTTWMRTDPPKASPGAIRSSNTENNDRHGFSYRAPDNYTYSSVPLYDEIAFIGLDGRELVKYVTPNSTKTHYPFSSALLDVSKKENTYVKAESYFEALKELEPGEIYVSDVIGAYVPSNFTGMYTPTAVETAASDRGYDIPYAPENQAYAGVENPNGRRFEGIVRWAMPVTDGSGAIIGYVTFALNHDHIMEFVDHQNPTNSRYQDVPSANQGNYAFIWDYQCRSICHPRHQSIVGYDPATGEPQIPWLETSIYDGWQESGIEKWTDYVKTIPAFDRQTREKKPSPLLTKEGLVGLDGRYLNNAPQCIGWMDLTRSGGSGSFYILWSGIYKLNTAAAIRYYTGQYAPSAENGYSQRGFGFVAIGSGLDDFTKPATETGKRLSAASATKLNDTSKQLIAGTAFLVTLVILIAILLATYLTGNIHNLIRGISRFRAGERQFRFHSRAKDEFGTLANSFDGMADSIVDSVNHAQCIVSPALEVIYMNDACQALCGLTLEEAVGSNYSDISVYPHGTVYDPILALVEERETDIYLNPQSGRYVKAAANHFLGRDGEMLGYIIETRDLTDMVLEQKETEEQRALLDEIFAVSPDLIWYVDAQGHFITVNPRFASILGIAPGDFIGKSARELFSPKEAKYLDEYFKKTVASGTSFYSEDKVDFADGHQETLDAVRTPIYDADGALVGILGFARDVSVRVRMENALRDTQLELEAAVAEANQANEHKGSFLARMSHEIRTPMNAIIGLTALVQKKLPTLSGPTDLAEVEMQMDRIATSSQHLLGLLNDILDLTKIDAGKIELTTETTNLSQLASMVVNIVKPRCEEKGIRFVTQFDPATQCSFLADALRLRQILINLLGNAVKFTPQGGEIVFAIRLLAQRDGRTHFEFSVQDTGIGIAKENLGAIFQAFEQAGNHISKEHGGTGLGLSISQRIVSLMGGEIQVESEVSKGSRFFFRLWLEEKVQVDSVDAASHLAGDKLAGKRILVVDDVEINRVVVLSMLEDLSLDMEEAANGREALELVARSPQNHFDAILMDVQMPVMDGYESAAAIRALGRADTDRVPIIALTANAFTDDIQKAIAHGMNAHVAKPVEYEQLLTELLRFLD